ncbi:MAG: hypothetical protein LBU27_08510 [Candidatus Peribacteria bacterium]|nr:hypothetical protein [Candidatus Peribacteria bacterium]
MCPITNGEFPNSVCSIYNLTHSGSSYESTDFDTSIVEGQISAELSINSISNEVSEVLFTVYDKNGNEINAVSLIDDTPVLQVSGQWGVGSYNNETVIDDITIYRNNKGLTLNVNKSVVSLGETIIYTISDDEEKTITLSDNGANGNFSLEYIMLNAANNYTATIQYTPTRAGEITILASSNDDNVDNTIFVSPYSTIIGFIGDSITEGIC